MLAAVTFAGPPLGLFSMAFGVWLFASTVTVTLVAAVWLVAVAAERAGRQRSQLEGMLVARAETAPDAIVMVAKSASSAAAVVICSNPLHDLGQVAPGLARR